MEKVQRWRSWLNGRSCSAGALQETQIIPCTIWLVFWKHNISAIESGRTDCGYYPTFCICRAILYLWPRNKLKGHCQVVYFNGCFSSVLPAIPGFFSAWRLKQIKAFVCLLFAFHSSHSNETGQIHLSPCSLLISRGCLHLVIQGRVGNTTIFLLVAALKWARGTTCVQSILWKGKRRKNWYKSKCGAEKSSESLGLFVCLWGGNSNRTTDKNATEHLSMD